MPSDVKTVLLRLNGNPPAGSDALAQFESASRFELPQEYVRFLRQANGGEGFVGPAYVILWRLEELLQFNEDYQVDEYAPGLFLFGSDGGGEAFAFDTRVASKPIVSVPFVGMALEEARPIANDFDAFLVALSAS